MGGCSVSFQAAQLIIQATVHQLPNGLTYLVGTAHRVFSMLLQEMRKMERISGTLEKVMKARGDC